jgi:LPXTG-motif cell wall-anchored protein
VVPAPPITGTPSHEAAVVPAPPITGEPESEEEEENENEENEVTGKGNLPSTGDGMNPIMGSLGLTSMISFGTVYIKSKKKLAEAVSQEKAAE